MNKLISFNLRRIVSDKSYIPEVDGYRFMSLSAVVLQHQFSFWSAKVGELQSSSLFFTSFWRSITMMGDVGLESFFIISGYLLGMPFAQQYFGNGKEIKLGNYYKRRLLRLEPPYILSMILLFLFSAFLVRKYAVSTLFVSLLASLTYTHNFFYGREVFPLVNMVAWSLEVEVQFYLLAPLLARIFLLPKDQRRPIMLLVAFGSLAIKAHYQLPFRSIIDYAHFFSIGFLMADMKVASDNIRLKKTATLILGISSIILLIVFNAFRVNNTAFFVNTGLFLVLTLLVYLIFQQRFLKSFLSIEFFAIIGGMCYSVYLLHAAVLSVVLGWYLRHLFFNSYLLDFFTYSVISIAIITVVSAAYFIVIERPCMHKDWPKLLWNSVRKIFRRPEKKEEELSILS